MRNSLSTIVAIALAVYCCVATPQLSAQSPPNRSLPDQLTRAIASYAALQSYADSGTVTVDTGSMVDKARFTTYFRRASRDLFFEFQSLSSLMVSTKFTIDMRAHRSVLWMFNGTMQAYKTPSVQPLEMVGSDARAQVQMLSGLAYATRGAAIMIPSMLYSQARLPSSILQIEQATLAGLEPIDGRSCHKVVGTAAAYYPNGRRTSVRPVTVWIDADTQLVRRVLEDTPEGYGDGKATLRISLDYQPQANPALDDSKFQFTPPAK